MLRTSTTSVRKERFFAAEFVYKAADIKKEKVVKTTNNVITTLVMLVAAAGMALAEDGDKYAYVLGSYLEPDIAFNQDNGAGVQIGLGYEVGTRLNIEAYLRSTRADGSTKFENTAVGGDLLLVFNRDGKFQPYLLGGVGIQRSDLTGFDSEDGVVVNFGAGFLANVFGSSRTTLRAEYRYADYNSHNLRLDDQLLSIGLQFGFGGQAAPLAAPAAEPPPPPPPPPPPAPVPDPDSDNDGVIDRQDRCPGTRAGVEVDVNGCEIMEEIQLQGVHFESNSDRLVSGAQVVLDEAAATLIKNPGIRVEVAGHTDSDGDNAYNESLSARRAATVRDYLAARGVEMERMTMRGYGETQPIADNNTTEGKAANRRVVLRITSR